MGNENASIDITVRTEGLNIDAVWQVLADARYALVDGVADQGIDTVGVNTIEVWLLRIQQALQTINLPGRRKCAVCGGPILGSMYGYGNGSGEQFAHPLCYWRERYKTADHEVKRLRSDLADMKVERDALAVFYPDSDQEEEGHAGE